jgi:hypothetical protein
MNFRQNTLLFVAGLLLGWLIIGWLVWPIHWTNSKPADLLPEYQKIYIRMLAGDYWRDRNISMVREALSDWDEQALAKLLEQMINEANTAEEFEQLTKLDKLLSLPDVSFSIWDMLLEPQNTILLLTLGLSGFLLAGAMILGISTTISKNIQSLKVTSSDFQDQAPIRTLVRDEIIDINNDINVAITKENSKKQQLPDQAYQNLAEQIQTEEIENEEIENKQIQNEQIQNEQIQAKRIKVKNIQTNQFLVDDEKDDSLGDFSSVSEKEYHDTSKDEQDEEFEYKKESEHNDDLMLDDEEEDVPETTTSALFSFFEEEESIFPELESLCEKLPELDIDELIRLGIQVINRFEMGRMEL